MGILCTSVVAKIKITYSGGEHLCCVVALADEERDEEVLVRQFFVEALRHKAVQHIVVIDGRV